MLIALHRPMGIFAHQQKTKWPKGFVFTRENMNHRCGISDDFAISQTHPSGPPPLRPPTTLHFLHKHQLLCIVHTLISPKHTTRMHYLQIPKHPHSAISQTHSHFSQTHSHFSQTHSHFSQTHSHFKAHTFSHTPALAFSSPSLPPSLSLTHTHPYTHADSTFLSYSPSQDINYSNAASSLFFNLPGTAISPF